MQTYCVEVFRSELDGNCESFHPPPRALTSETLAIIINFLGRYNKPIITTETGTNNANQALFNAHMDIIKNMGVKVMVYFYGTGNLAEANLPFWEAWIAQ